MSTKKMRLMKDFYAERLPEAFNSLSQVELPDDGRVSNRATRCSNRSTSRRYIPSTVSFSTSRKDASTRISRFHMTNHCVTNPAITTKSDVKIICIQNIRSSNRLST